MAMCGAKFLDTANKSKTYDKMCDLSPMILRFFHVDDMDDKFLPFLTKKLLSEIYTFSNRSAYSKL